MVAILGHRNFHQLAHRVGGLCGPHDYRSTLQGNSDDPGLSQHRTAKDLLSITLTCEIESFGPRIWMGVVNVSDPRKEGYIYIYICITPNITLI